MSSPMSGGQLTCPEPCPDAKGQQGERDERLCRER